MQEVTTIRPASTSISPLFQSALSEAPVNLFRMKVQSQAADAKRMSFVWRAPGVQLLLSPLAYLEFEVEVVVPHAFSRLYNVASIQQAQNVGDMAAAVGAQYVQAGSYRHSASDGPAIAFGEGNAVMSCCESIQYVINGASLSHSNWNLFKRTLDQISIPADVAQRCFSRCGGSFNRYDAKCASRAVSNAGGNLNDDNTMTNLTSGQTQTAGMTCDSGLASRLKNFADNIVLAVGSEDEEKDYSEGMKFTVKIQAPLDGGVFNQIWGETGSSRSSIYSKLCLAIPNANSMAVTILFKDLEKSIIRRLGRNFVADSGAGDAIAGGRQNTAYPFSVKFKGTQASLHLQYLRLQSFRRYPEAVSLATYRSQTYIQEMVVKELVCVPNGNYSDTTGFTGPYLLPSGPDFKSCTGSAYLEASAARVWDCEFQNVQFAQPPSYILLVAQKTLDCTSYQNPSATVGVGLLNGGTAIAAAGTSNDVSTLAAADAAPLHYRNIAQNQDSNLSIVAMKFLVQSSVGSFEMTSDKYPFLLDTNMLWDVHKRNCCQEYLKEAGIMAWNRRCSAILLSSSDFLHGLGTSFGVSFPIQVSVSLKFQNRCTFADGIKYGDARAAGPILYRDYINARAALVGIFDRQVLQVSTSSAVLSAQNFTAATASSLLANRQ